jgi:transposase
LAQTNEKRLFLPLLRDLCTGIAEPEYDFGRPRLPLSEQIFTATYKVYSQMSSRRFISDLEDARCKGFITHLPHFNSVLNAFDYPETESTLQQLIQQSAMPLKALEADFAVDSTGFGTSRHEKWFSVKHQGMVSKRDWVKLHAMVGVRTNVVTSCEVTGRHGADGPQFAGLVNKTAKHFDIREVSADKACSSRKNLHAVQEAGGKAFIPFKSNATGAGNPRAEKGENALWNAMFHYYSLNRSEFLTHYHKRSNSESTFSMIKAKFGDALRSKSDTAQVNEALCKVLCHNLCCVISSIYELGIEPQFNGSQVN